MRVVAFLLIIGFAVASAGACSSRNTSVTLPSPEPSSPANAEGPPTSGTCDASKAQWAIGQRATDELLERARNAAQAKVARFIRPNEAVTLEFSPTRLNLRLNEKDVVASVSCG